jgi:hypothetical protein
MYPPVHTRSSIPTHRPQGPAQERSRPFTLARVAQVAVSSHVAQVVVSSANHEHGFLLAGPGAVYDIPVAI